MLIMIEIKDKNGKLKLSTVIGEGSIRRCTLMKEDYVTLVFSTDEPVYFKLGDGIDNEWGMFELVDLYSPTYNESTGGYDYQLRLDAYYWKWKNKIFKYTPESHGQEASWSLTATLDVHLGVFLRNLQALGYKYRNTPFSFEIGNTVENTSQLITYENTNLIDALNMMAETWDCEWWVTDSVIHFGKCEYGDPVKLELGVEVETMTREGNNQKFATRIYAFGSTNNIPSDYRPIDESVVVNGVVQKRLMLPEGTPYLDAYENMTQEEAVEDVVIFDDVYPRRIGTLSGITTQEYTDTIENEDGTTTEEKWLAYRFKDTGINFSKEYILPGQELKITFQSGKLNGLTFGVIFNPTLEGEEEKPEKLPDGSWNPEAQLWEIVRNEDYGRPLPGGELIPANGDTYYLTGFNIKLVSDQYIPAAEEELKEKAQKYLDKTKIDPNTYNCTLRPDYVYSKDLEEEIVLRTFELGDKINLVNPTFFSNGRVSRVIGYERKLDIPYDHPVYFVGEIASTSRIGELEDKVDALTYKGQTFTGNGSGVYVVGRYDSTPLSDRNVLSSLKAISTFLRKDMADSTPYLLRLLAGSYFGKYIEGQTGGKIDANGIAEFLNIILRGDLKSINFSTGALGSGYALQIDENGDSLLEVDRLLVRKIAYFVELVIQRMSHVGGQIVLTPASMKCIRVEEFDDYYRCYFESTDGDKTLTNDFVVGDQARCQTFNIKAGTSQNVSNSYYWRLVVGVGDDYIDLSKSDCDAGSTVPQADDEIVLLGNRTDATRQAAIVLAAYGEDAPYIKLYRGIDSYQLSGKEFLSFSRSQIKMIADELYFSTGESVSTVINGVKADLAETKTELQGQIGDVDAKVDGIQIGVRNLASKTKITNNAGATINGYEYTFSAQNTDGLSFNKDIFELNEEYVLSFRMHVNSGTLVNIGGHQSGFSVNNVEINGTKPGGTWNGGITGGLSTDNLIIAHVKKVDGTDASNIGLWIQPNRLAGTIVNVTISEISVVKGNKYVGWYPAPEDIQAEVEAAQQAASDAQEAATAAQSDATEAKTELNQINSDSVISPVEKTALKQQQADIQAEYNEIIADAGRYSISTTAYKNAYTSANNALTKYTATSPTYITVGSDYANIAAYYDARQTILNSIAAAAKKASDDAMQAAEDEAELAKWRAIGYSWNSGKPLWTDDPTFKEGLNGLIVYGSGILTHEAKQSDSPVNDSAYNLKVVSKGNAGFGLGGFSRQLYTRANAVFVLRLIAKIPNGYRIVSAYNNFGTNGEYHWVTSTNGTGRFEEYIVVFRCGASGDFSTIGFFTINGNPPVTWYVAYAGAFDVTAGVSTGEQLQTVSGTVTTLSSELTNTKEAFESYKGEVESKFTAAATATEEQIENAVVNLQKGMRNLVLNGKVDIVGSAEYNVHNFDLSKDLVVGNKYTLITKAKPTSNQQYCFYDSAAQNRLLTFLLGDFTNGVACKTFTYNPKSSVTNHARIRIYNYPSSSSAANPLDVEWVCLYEGDITDTAPDYFVNAPEDLNLEINSVKQSVSAIEQKADSIELSVTTVETKVDNLQVGGRNLLKNSKLDDLTGWNKDANPSGINIVDFDGYKCLKVESGSSGVYTSRYGNLVNSPYSGEMTTSIDVYATKPLILSIGIEGIGNRISKIDTINQWVRLSTTQNCDGEPRAFIIYCTQNQEHDGIYFKNVKLEVGNKATDWSPAPEDLEAAAQEAKDLADAAQAAADNAQSSADSALDAANDALNASNSGKLYVKGTGYDVGGAAVNPPRQVILNNNGVNIAIPTARGMNLITLNRSDLSVGYNLNYDYTTSRINSLIERLNSLTDNVIVILTSKDNFSVQGDTLTNLLEATSRCGGSGNAAAFDNRVPYALVGIPGIGKGAGIEVFTSSLATAPAAEISTQIINGIPVGISTQAKNMLEEAKDYTADRTLPTWRGWIDVTQDADGNPLDENKYYPLTIRLYSTDYTNIRLKVNLNSGTKPSWATHNSGFTVNCEWNAIGSGWGVNPSPLREIIEYSRAFTNTETLKIDNEDVTRTIEPVASIGQITQYNYEYIYLRGGGKYYFEIQGITYNSSRTEFAAQDIQLHTTTFVPNSSAPDYKIEVLTPEDITIIERTNVTNTDYKAGINNLADKVELYATKKLTFKDGTQEVVDEGNLQVGFDAINGYVGHYDASTGKWNKAGFMIKEGYAGLFAGKANDKDGAIQNVLASIYVTNTGQAVINGKNIEINGNTTIKNNAGQIVEFFGNSGEVFNVNNGVFKVTNTGAMTATSGKIGGFTIDGIWLRGDDGLSISDALINIDKTDRSVYIGGHPDESVGGKSKLGYFRMTNSPNNIKSGHAISLYCAAPYLTTNASSESFGSFAFWADGESVLTGLTFYADSTTSRTGTVTITPYMSVIAIGGNVTLKASDKLKTSRFAHFLLIVNTSTGEHDVYGTTGSDRVIRFRNRSCKVVVFWQGQWYAHSDYKD